jgi:N-acetylglutamate synthase-like GNAT family acetyltransferase
MARIQVDRYHTAARRRIVAGLLAFNAEKVGKSSYKALTVTLRESRRIVGGVAGWIWKDWCLIDLLWIEAAYRVTGRGAALMNKAEAEARKRGAKYVFLDTFSFQAPGFYKKLGYKEFGRLKNFPRGHARHFFQKTL